MPSTNMKKELRPKLWYCEKCGANVPEELVERSALGEVPKHKIKECPGCKRSAGVFDFKPTEENVKKFWEDWADATLPGSSKSNVKKGMEITKKEALTLNAELQKPATPRPMADILLEEKQRKEMIAEKMADPNLLVDAIKEIQKEVAGEEDTICTLIIVTTTRLVEDAIAESKNLFLSDITGIGKDFTTKKTLEVLVPKEERLHVTKMSKEAFTYWHAFEEGWNWDNKIIHFEDITQELLNSSTFKVMSSGGSYAVVVKDQKTIEIPINGKSCMILTSHHANPQSEALRRFPIGSLNDTHNQTRRIKAKVSRKYTGGESVKPDCILRCALQNLKPCSAIIPYAELIQHFFPEDILMRTHYQRFLDYICASTVFHQCQRERTDDGKLIATPDDYMIARLTLIYTTSNPKMIPMTKEYRDLTKLLQENIEPMTVNEIYVKYNKSKDWLYKNLPNLIETKLVEMGKRYEEKANKDVFTYQYALGENPYSIPTWNEIGNKILEIANKTNKTTKTTHDSPLEKWFYDNKIKPIKPKNGEFSVVLFGHNNTFSREVLLVFLVLGNYLRQRDEKRYQRYYKEPEKTELALHDKLNELRKTIKENRKAGYKIDDVFLSNNFDSSFISKCIESGQLVRQPNGEHITNIGV